VYISILIPEVLQEAHVLYETVRSDERSRDDMNIIPLIPFLLFCLLGCSGAEKADKADTKLDDAFLVDSLDLRLHYFFEPVPVKKVMALEDSLGAVSKPFKGNRGGQIEKPRNRYVPPLRYQRRRTGLLRPQTLYIYSTPDSLVRYIEYTFLVDAQDSTQYAVAAQNYFGPKSGLYPHLKRELTLILGQTSEPEMVQYFLQKPAGVRETRFCVWKRDDMAVTLHVIESQSVSVKITFSS
jgi:hypothetical protein